MPEAGTGPLGRRKRSRPLAAASAMARWMALLAILVLLVLAAAGYGALHYMTAVPGEPHRGALPPLTAEEEALAAALKRHVATIAAREHNVDHYDELEKVARYLEATLASFGYAAGRQEFPADGKTVRNIDATIEPRATISDPEVIVVGAHYDSAQGTPGANDNASGAAAVLELARLLRDLDGRSGKRIRFVLFVNEEPPYFRTEAMGSLNYAARARRSEASGWWRCIRSRPSASIRANRKASAIPRRSGSCFPIAATSSPSSACWARARWYKRR